MHALVLFVIWALIVLWIVYAPLAELIFHVFHVGTIYAGNELTREVALTFDDGPNPAYTPELLDLLDEYGAQAVFFVVGEHAERYPKLLRAIHERGHIIGSHTSHHYNAWFVSPFRMRKEVRDTQQTIESLIGEPVRFFRPPWGRFNIFLPAILRQASQIPVLWSFAGYDWKKGDQAERIALTIAKKVHNGSIILLHDNSGESSAPANTLRALRAILPRLKEIGFALNANPVLHAKEARVQRKGLQKRPLQRLIHPIWSAWEALFNHLYHVHPMTRIFRMSTTPWHFGPRFVENSLPSESTANHGASYVAAASELLVDDGVQMVEVHLQNLALQELVKIDSPEKMAVRSLRELRASLRDLAKTMVYDDRYRFSQGFFGITVMHRGVEKLGFHVEEIDDTLGNRWVSLILFTIMVINHPQGLKRLRTGLGDMRPKLVWMDRQTLLERYLDEDVPEKIPSVEQIIRNT